MRYTLSVEATQPRERADRTLADAAHLPKRLRGAAD